MYVIDGAAPGSVGSSTMQVDSETVVGASVNIDEATFSIRGAEDASAPCVIKRDEKNQPADEDAANLAEGMRGFMEMGEKKMAELQDAGIDTMPILSEDTDGYGTRSGEGMMPSSVSASPIKNATGWAAAPADAKEFTILLSKGMVRRVGLILKNENGIL